MLETSFMCAHECQHALIGEYVLMHVIMACMWPHFFLHVQLSE